MDDRDLTHRVAEAIVGFSLHSVLAVLAAPAVGLVFSALFRVIIGPMSPAMSADLKIAFLVVPLIVIASFAVPRLAGWSAPWVGVPGVLLFWIGARDLLKYWSPSSHQTRIDALLSQLFCIRSGCSETEGLDALLFGWPSFCLVIYSLCSLVVLGMTRRQSSHPHTVIQSSGT